MVKRGKIAWLVLGAALVCASCSKYDFGGMIAAGSSVQERFDNSMALPDRDSHPGTVATPGDGYRFLVATDFHLRGEDDWDRLGRFLSRVRSESFLLGTLLGDYMYEAGSSLERLSDSLRPREEVTFVTAIGNHEVYKDGYQKTYRAVFGATCYALRVESAGCFDLFIVLDSANGTLGIRQYDWLESVLANERPGARHCFVCTHANFFSPPGYLDVISTYPVDEMMKVLNLFSKHRVTAVFTGHSHVRDETTLRGVKYITVGSWCDNKREWCEVECRPDGSLNIGFRPVD